MARNPSAMKYKRQSDVRRLKNRATKSMMLAQSLKRIDLARG